jgi:hypothetical protein
MTERLDLSANIDSNDTSTEAVARLLARVDDLERRLATTEQKAVPVAPPARTDRRAFLRLAGVATAGVAVAALATDRAAAADGGNVVLGQANSETNPATITNSGTAGVSISALKGVGPSDSNGLWGDSAGTSGAGVYGTAAAGFGVFGSSATGYDFYGGGNGRVGLVQHLTSGSPTSGSYAIGDIFRNGAGDLWLCVVGGAAPAVAKFRKLGGPAAAGQTHFLPTPVRAYDSISSGQGQLSGGPRTISLATAVPAGANAVLFSATAYNTFGAGYMTIFSSAVATVPTFNTLLWTQSNTFVVANSFSAIANQQLKVYVYPGAQTDFQVDVTGYML